jgi:hypothetical protein
VSTFLAPPAAGEGRKCLYTLIFLGFLSGLICAARPLPASVPFEATVGVIFGIIIGGGLWWMRLIQPGKAVLFIVASEACWLAAYYFAKDVTHGLIGEHWYTMLLVGILSGILGAASLGLCCRFLFPFFNSWRLLLCTAILGGATGAVMVFKIEFLLFPLWQAGFALCLGVGISSAGRIKKDRI